jgi:hypothetical protein
MKAKPDAGRLARYDCVKSCRKLLFETSVITSEVNVDQYCGIDPRSLLLLSSLPVSG